MYYIHYNGFYQYHIKSQRINCCFTGKIRTNDRVARKNTTKIYRRNFSTSLQAVPCSSCFLFPLPFLLWNLVNAFAFHFARTRKNFWALRACAKDLLRTKGWLLFYFSIVEFLSFPEISQFFARRAAFVIMNYFRQWSAAERAFAPNYVAF